MDARITPARSDLAALHLKGSVEAARFAQGTPCRIVRGRTSLRRAPRADAERASELLFGENFTVYETANGWAWGQAQRDLYVGYVEATDLTAGLLSGDHRISVLMSPLLGAGDIKSVPLDMLPMNAKVKVVGLKGEYAEIAPAGLLSRRHLIAADRPVADWVSVAEQFVGVPYVWGGKTQAGVDCSGLIQTALEAGGVAAPRDTDMQEQALGRPLASSDRPARGDLVFWSGHMGVMLDGARLLHANAYHMAVAIEPLQQAVNRIMPVAGPVTSIRRL